MSGLFGGTPGTVKQDRQNQLDATAGLKNVFNYGMKTGAAGQNAGNAAVNDALGYWTRQMQAGRSETAQNAAPALNAETDQADAERREQAQQGTARAGGTAEVNAEAGAKERKNIDDLINKTMTGQRNAAASNVGNLGALEMQNANNLLGLGANAEGAVMSDADESRKTSEDIAKRNESELGQTIGGLITAALAI